MTDSDQQPRMRVGHYVLSVVILVVALTMLGYLIHAVILSADYQGVAHLYRAEPLFVPLLTGNLCFACAVMWISNYFYHASGGLLARRTKLGIALWLLWVVPVFLIDYAGQPIPFAFSAKLIALELVDMLVIGLLAAAMTQTWHRR